MKTNAPKTAVKLTRTQRRALLHLLKRSPDEWINDTPVRQRTLNILQQRGLVQTAYDPALEAGDRFIERLTDEGRRVAKEINQPDPRSSAGNQGQTVNKL